MNDTPTPPRALRYVKFFVAIAGMLVGGGFGALAGLFVSQGSPLVVLLGIGLGAAGGLLAGLLWGRLILPPRALHRSRTRSNLICLLGGPFAGILVGWMATTILWLGLSFVPPPPADPEHGPDVVGMMLGAMIIFGTPAGAVTGLVCGIAAAIAMPRRDSDRS
ncbi:MAG: hypothetical protein ACYS8X_05210 [Planctomycetota bacterium]|jgi:hypothetical protein